MRRLFAIATAAALALASGCTQCQEPDKKAGDSPRDPLFGNTKSEKSVDLPPGSTSTATSASERPRASAKPLTLMTPEQFSASVAEALGYESVEERGTQARRDLLVANHALALGGVDFEGANERDPTPSVQSLLTIRTLAFQIATKVVGDENDAQNKAAKARDPSESENTAKRKASSVFAKVDLEKDRPFAEKDFGLPSDEQAAVRAGEERWGDQIEELYWRLLSRAPTTEEKDALKKSFTAFAAAEETPVKGWILVLFTLLSSMEYWNL